MSAAADRQERILGIVREQRHVRNSDLSALLGVSVVTIRQDIEALETVGNVRKTYGGAVVDDNTSHDTAYAARAKKFRSEKQRIGAAAARLIGPSETVILDAGTTTFEIARRLPENADVTIITCALNVALEAGARAGVGVMVCGGMLNPRTLSVAGPQAERILADVHADRIFLATYGADMTKGLTDRNIAAAQMKRALTESAREVVLVCDSSKFGEIAPFIVGPLDMVHRVITDAGIPAALAEYFERRGVPVEIV
jgi:DeoR family transcriptional regulator, aga operon transcriptional repressor